MQTTQSDLCGTSQSLGATVSSSGHGFVQVDKCLKEEQESSRCLSRPPGVKATRFARATQNKCPLLGGCAVLSPFITTDMVKHTVVIWK